MTLTMTGMSVGAGALYPGLGRTLTGAGQTEERVRCQIAREESRFLRGPFGRGQGREGGERVVWWDRDR